MKAPPALRSVVRRLRRLGDLVPPTWRGILVTGLSAGSLWLYAFGSLDLVLFVVGVAGLVLVAASTVLVTVAALRLRRRLPRAEDAPLRLEAGYPVRTGFEAPSFERWPLVQIRWQWRSPAGVEVRLRPLAGERALVEEVVAERRAEVSGPRRRLLVEDAFGLARIAWERDEATRITVLPNVGALRQAPVVQAMSAAEGIPHPGGAPEGDRMEIRRYVPGDSVRHILWKTFARTGQLNVRLPERSIDPARKTVAYLITGDDDEAAAAAARVALERGALGERWVFGADGTREPCHELEPALHAIARSGGYRERAQGRGSGLRDFLERAAGDGDAQCIVFAPAREGAWTREALDAARAWPGSLAFVLGTDGVARDEPRPLWHRALFAQPAATGVRDAQLRRVLATVATTGGPALVVDRLHGRAYGPAQQRSLGAAA